MMRSSAIGKKGLEYPWDSLDVYCKGILASAHRLKHTLAKMGKKQ